MVTIKKVYPIKNRKDFFKFVIMDNGKIAKDFYGKDMYFLSKESAEYVANAIRKVKKMRKQKQISASKTTSK